MDLLPHSIRSLFDASIFFSSWNLHLISGVNKGNKIYLRCILNIIALWDTYYLFMEDSKTSLHILFRATSISKFQSTSDGNIPRIFPRRCEIKTFCKNEGKFNPPRIFLDVYFTTRYDVMTDFFSCQAAALLRMQLSTMWYSRRSVLLVLSSLTIISLCYNNVFYDLFS